jgi:hypothetical protein
MNCGGLQVSRGGVNGEIKDAYRNSGDKCDMKKCEMYLQYSLKDN